MTDALNATVPPGWHPDPWGSTAQRWWDGQAWTENLYPPQPDVSAAAQLAAPVSATAATSSSGEQELDTGFEPPKRRATFESPNDDIAAAYTNASPPSAASIVVNENPLPSRRELRALGMLGATTVDDGPEEFAPPVLASPDEFESIAAAAQPVASTPSVAAAQPVAFIAPAAAAPPLTQSDAKPAREEPHPVALESFPPPERVDPPTIAAGTLQVAGPETSDDWAASLKFGSEGESFTAPQDASPIFGDAPPVSYSQRSAHYKPLHGRTSSVWLIVFIPLLQAAAVIGSIFVYPDFKSYLGTGAVVISPELLDALLQWSLFIATPLAVLFLIFTLVLAFQDRSRLRLLGHDRTASPWWVLLSSLVYLIVRSVRVQQSTGRKVSGPLTTFICLYIAPGLALGIANVVITAMDGALPS